MSNTTLPILVIFVFPLVILMILGVIYYLQRSSPSKASQEEHPKSNNNNIELDESLVVILQMEFEYISKTASEAMQDRHNMTNFYIATIAIIITGVTNILSSEHGSSAGFSIVLLSAGCLIGLFFYLKIIRLRQAWVESINAMNHIKNSLIEFSKEDQSKFLKYSFLWTSLTAPKGNQLYNVFHYSAVFIGFINACLYVTIIYLMFTTISTETTLDPSNLKVSVAALSVIGFAIVFWTHHKFYKKFLT